MSVRNPFFRVEVDSRETPIRLLENGHLRCFPHPLSLRRTSAYASGRLTNSSAWQESLLIRHDATLRISGALHLTVFEKPGENIFFSTLVVEEVSLTISLRSHKIP
jgi:hypothetical protein